MTTRSTPPVQLTSEQKQQFIRDGYLIVRGVVPEDIAAQTRTALLDALDMKIDAPETWKRDQNVLFAHTDLTVACTTSAYWEVAEQLAGPDIHRGAIYSPYREARGEDPWMTGFVPVLVYPTPGEKKFDPQKGYHIDGMHKATLWPRELSLVAFLYLTDVEDDGGATAVWPGGHRRMFEHWYRRQPEGKDSIPDYTPELELGQPVPFVGKAGDIVFMHYLLPHSGTPNRGHTIRMGLNTVIPPNRAVPYPHKKGSPADDWTPLDWTLRTDRL